MTHYRRGNLTFDVIDAGPANGPVTLLLHGFPQFNTSWSKVIPRLTAQGYPLLGAQSAEYSPGARPARRRDYRIPELIDDIRALIDASGAQRVHLVGHGWGAVVAWGVAAEIPDRLATVSPLSAPHRRRSSGRSLAARQALASWYTYVFQLPFFLNGFFSVGREGLPDCRKRCSRVSSHPTTLIATRVRWLSPAR